MDRWKRPIELGLAALVGVGALLLMGLALAPPLRIGEGRFGAFVAELERTDFKVPLLFLGLLTWLLPAGLLVVWRRSEALGLESDRIKAAFEPFTRPVPVQVEIDARIPVRIAEPMVVPVAIDTRVPVDEEVEIEADVPVRMTIPIDTEVTTTVLRFGTITFPVRGEVPVDLVMPVRGRFRVRASMGVKLREQVQVEMPPFEVPVASRLETRIDLVASLRKMRERGDA
jgi:hypothetical protein